MVVENGMSLVSPLRMHPLRRGPAGRLWEDSPPYCGRQFSGPDGRTASI